HQRGSLIMDLYQLEAFVAVAQERSFSRAAVRLHRTQSAVSQTIGKLEDLLGEKVFERSSRDGTMTAAGNEFTSLCLLPALHLYHRRHPSIKIQVQRTLAGDVPRQVLMHQAEFG